jgi:DNA-binding winged helix-turn-helix (wHTH) protein/TolB-like protein/Tfp pilus assembly protein PilF
VSDDRPKKNISFAEFELNIEQRRLLRDHASVALNAKAFDLLVFLAENPGRVLSKEEILDRVWEGQFVEEANLTVQISTLRKALNENKEAPRFLVTVPGKGYKFIAETEQKAAAITDDDNSGVFSEEKRNQPAAASVQSGWPVRRPAFIFAAIVIVSLLVFAGFRYFRPVPKNEIRSLAVLPFKPLVAENRNESLEMGMADTLITKLSNFREIQVRPISAVRRYAGIEQDALAAGREQTVDAVLDGQIQQAGEKIRVTVRLVKVDDGALLWTKQFDEKISDIFGLQDSISERVADALAIELTGEQKSRIVKRQTENAEAYQLYLLGRFHFGKRNRDGVAKSIEYFNQAIEKDANYAAAYAALAEAYSTSGWFEFLAPREVYPKAKDAVAKALQLDETLPEAYTALGDIKRGYDWDLAGAERAYRRALELDPKNPMTHHSYGLSLGLMGRREESIGALQQALQLDPLSPTLNKTYGDLLMFAHRPDEAIVQYRKVQELNPYNPYNFLSMGLCYLQKDSPDEALAEFLRAANLAGKSSAEIEALKTAYARAKMRGFFLELIRQNMQKQGFISAYNMASLYAAAGEKEEALNWLDKAFEQHSSGMAALKVDPIFDNLRNEPRFNDLIRRVGLPL